MAKEHLSRRPYTLRGRQIRKKDPDWWCYEYPEGLTILHRGENTIAGARIPLAKIRAYLARLDEEE